MSACFEFRTHGGCGCVIKSVAAATVGGVHALQRNGIKYLRISVATIRMQQKIRSGINYLTLLLQI